MKKHLLILSIIACASGFLSPIPPASALSSKLSLNASPQSTQTDVNYTGVNEDGDREEVTTGKGQRK